MSRIFNDAPSMIGENTSVKVFSQGITYSDPGITYSDPGISYGGIYNITQDIIPIVSMTQSIVPSIYGYLDLYNPFIPDPNKGMLIAPGLPWQFLTYP